MNRTPTFLVIAAMAVASASVATRVAVAATVPQGAMQRATPTPALTPALKPATRSSSGKLPGVIIKVDATPSAASTAPPAALPHKPKAAPARKGSVVSSGPQGQTYSTDSTLRSPGGQITQSNPAH
jgi:hypothetical protein